MNRQSLGKALREQQEMNEEERFMEAAQRERERNEKAAEKYRQVKDFFERAKKSFERQIVEEGSVAPLVSGYREPASSHFQDTLKGTPKYGTKVPNLCNPTSPYFDIWKDICDWAKNSDLSIEVAYTHDGGGIESWYNFVVKPR